MIYLFESPDGTVFIVEICDVGNIDSPIKLAICDRDSRVTFESGGIGWFLISNVLDLVDNGNSGGEDEDENLETHSPIVDLVASIHYAAVCEPDAMGVL